MKLKQEELRKQERNSNQVNEITEGDLLQAFGVTEDQMEKAATILSRSERTEKDYENEHTDDSTEEKEVFFINTGNA